MLYHYCFWVVLCCLVLFISLGIYCFLRYRRKPKVKTEPINPFDDSFLIQDYWEFDLEHSNRLLEQLENVRCTNPRERTPDCWDVWFKKSTEAFFHDAQCLARIQHFGYLEDLFWENIDELGLTPQDDEIFQCLIISVSSSEWHRSNYQNLLYHFAKRYELLPQVKERLENDPRLARSRETYEHGRQNAE